MLKGLAGKIPGLISIDAGTDINRGDVAWDLVLVSIHASKVALDLYQDHEEHLISEGIYRVNCP